MISALVFNYNITQSYGYLLFFESVQFIAHKKYKKNQEQNSVVYNRTIKTQSDVHA